MTSFSRSYHSLKLLFCRFKLDIKSDSCRYRGLCQTERYPDSSNTTLNLYAVTFGINNLIAPWQPISPDVVIYVRRKFTWTSLWSKHRVLIKCLITFINHYTNTLPASKPFHYLFYASLCSYILMAKRFSHTYQEILRMPWICQIANKQFFSADWPILQIKYAL